MSKANVRNVIKHNISANIGYIYVEYLCLYISSISPSCHSIQLLEIYVAIFFTLQSITKLSFQGSENVAPICGYYFS